MTLISKPLYQQDIATVDQLDLNFYKLKGSKILVSGGTGLIGTVLIDMLDYLNIKHNLNLEIYIITRNVSKSSVKFNHIQKTKINFFEHNINDPLSTDISFDFIIHGASNTHPLLYSQEPINSLTTNIFGTYNLLNLASKNPSCRFALLSSVEIYGEDTLNLPNGFSETDFGYLDCNTVRANYCEGKRASESLCQAFSSQKKVDVVIPRLCRCYGPSLLSDDSKALSQFIKNAIKGENIVLKSKGNQYFSYLYSSDAASGILFVLLNGESKEAYNISDINSNIKLCDLAELIANFTNTQVKYEIPDSTESQGYSKASRAILNNEKILTLGWKPNYSINEGIFRTINILKNN